MAMGLCLWPTLPVAGVVVGSRRLGHRDVQESLGVLRMTTFPSLGCNSWIRGVEIFRNPAVSQRPAAAPPSEEFVGEDDALLIEKMRTLLEERRTGEAWQAMQSLISEGKLPDRECASRLVAQLVHCRLPSSLAYAQQFFSSLRTQNEVQLLDSNCLGLLAVACSRSGASSFALNVVKLMFDKSLYLPPVKVWSAVVGSLTRHGDDCLLALKLFDDVCLRVREAESQGRNVKSVRPDIGAFNAALSACATLGFVKKGGELLRELRSFGLKENSLTFNILIKLYSKTNQRDLLKRVPDQIVEAGVKPDMSTLNLLLAAYVGLGDLHEAEEIIRGLKEQEKYKSGEDMDNKRWWGASLSPDVRMYTTMIKGYVQKGRRSDAMRTFLAMEQEKDPRSLSSEVTYMAAMSSCVRLGLMDEACVILQEMAAQNMTASVTTYNILLRGYCSSRQLHKACAVVADMERAGVSLDVVSYNTLLNGSIEMDDNIRALECFRKMREAGIAQSEASITALMKAFGGNGQSRELHETGMQKRVQKGWLKLLSTVQHAKLTKTERLQLLVQLLDIMYDSGLKVNAMHISAAVSLCVKEKAMNTAETIVDRARAMNQSSVNEYVYAKLLQGYCSSNQRKEAFALLVKMDAEGVKHDVVIYNTLIETEQSPEGVEILWEELKLRAIQPNERTYCAAIRCYGRAGQLGAVRKLWHEMVSQDVTFTIFTFNSLLDVRALPEHGVILVTLQNTAYANVGDVEACKAIIDEIYEQKLKVTKDSYNTLLKAHARCRDADGAVGVLRHMQRKGVKPCIISYNTAMDACIRGRDMLRATGLAKELPLHRLKADLTTFATLLRSAGLLRNTALVHKVLEDMKSSGCSHDETTYRCAVYAYVHCGEGGLALDMLEKMTATGFPPAMTVPEVLVKSVDAALLRECTAAAPAGKLDQFLADMAVAGLTPTRETAGAMVRKLAHTPGVDVALDLADKLRRQGIIGLGLHTWQSVIGVSVARVEQNPSQASVEVIRTLDSLEADGTTADRMIYESALSVFVKCGDGERAINVYEKMRKAKLSPASKEDGKDPLQRMLLDTMDAALVGALIAGLEATGGDDVQGGGATATDFPRLSRTALIVQDLADAGIRVKPEAMTKAIRQLCADVQVTVQTPESNGAVAVRKPTAGTSHLPRTAEISVEEKKIQRLERAMQLVENSNCLFGMQATSFVYGALMEASIRLQRGERVEILWQRMRLAGVAPDLRTWVSRIQALASVGQLKGRTHELLAEAAKDRLELHSVILRAMMKACHQVRDAAGVAHIKRMLNTSGRVQPFNTLVPAPSKVISSASASTIGNFEPTNSEVAALNETCS